MKKTKDTKICLETNRKIIIFVTVLTMFAFLVYLLDINISFESHEKVACKYAVALSTANYKDLCRYCDFDVEDYLYRNILLEAAYGESSNGSMQEAYDELEENYGIKIKNEKDISPKKVAEIFKNQKSLIKEEYGSFEAKAKVLGERELSESELKEAYVDALHDMGYYYVTSEKVNVNEINKAYMVYTEVTITGEKSEMEKTLPLTLVKYDGKWKVLDTTFKAII